MKTTISNAPITELAGELENLNRQLDSSWQSAAVARVRLSLLKRRRELLLELRGLLAAELERE